MRPRVRNRDKRYKPKLLFTKGCGGRGCEFVGDWPAPVALSSYWSLAPGARFIMIDFDADNGAPRRSRSEAGGVATRKRPDCRVPLAFDADDAWHDTAVAVATANQTAAAAPRSRRSSDVDPRGQTPVAELADGASHAVGATQRIRGVPLPPTLDTNEFPGAAPSTTKSCAFNRGSCADALACVMGDRARACATVAARRRDSRTRM